MPVLTRILPKRDTSQTSSKPMPNISCIGCGWQWYLELGLPIQGLILTKVSKCPTILLSN